VFTPLHILFFVLVGYETGLACLLAGAMETGIINLTEQRLNPRPFGNNSMLTSYLFGVFSYA